MSNVYLETHSGWTIRQEVTGEWSIIDQSGWVLASIHYDSRFTSNVTNSYRAELLSKAPETFIAYAALRAENERLRGGDRSGMMEKHEIVAREIREEIVRQYLVFRTENERLREALETVLDQYGYGIATATKVLARAALAGESRAGKNPQTADPLQKHDMSKE